MNASSLKVILQNNMGMLFEPESYKEYLKQATSIHGYDFMNRFLIFFQNRRATDVKNELAWIEVGRIVSESSKPLWVIIPVYKTKYIDKETGKELNSGELTPMEINQAVNLGIIERRKEIVDFESCGIYNISDTVIVDEDKAVEYESSSKREGLKLSILCNICKKLCGMKIASTNGKTLYKEDIKTLYVGNEPGVDKASAIIEILVGCMIERLTNDYELYTGDISDMTYDSKLLLNDTHKRFLRESILYTVYNYLGIIVDYTFDYVNEVYKVEANAGDGVPDLTNEMNCIEYLINCILSNFRSVKHNDSTSRILAMRKAEQLLDILEANNARLLIEGGLSNERRKFK